MAAPASPYTRLPGRGLRRTVVAISATRCRLYLAADHLLAVDSTIASEEYRRFYFRDIEAFIVRRTARRLALNITFLVLLVLTAGPFAIAWGLANKGSVARQGAHFSFSFGWDAADVGLLLTAIIIAFLWLLVILINTLRGPTVETKVRTAVQLEQLPSLGRLAVARKVIARLEPLIIAAQGAATPGEIAAGGWSVPDSTRPLAGTPELHHESGVIHYALFGTLLADAASTVVAFAFFRDSMGTFATIGGLITMAGTVLCVMALMRQADSDLPDPPRVVTKAALVLYILSFVAGFVFAIMFAVRHPGAQVRTGAEIVNEPGFEIFAMVSAGISMVLGFAGFAAMHAPRRLRHTL